MSVLVAEGPEQEAHLRAAIARHFEAPAGAPPDTDTAGLPLKPADAFLRSDVRALLAGSRHAFEGKVGLICAIFLDTHSTGLL